jgi:phage gp36-like protein
MDEVDAERQVLHHRIFLNGGMFLEVLPLARRKAERTRAEQRAKDAIAEIDSYREHRWNNAGCEDAG